MRSLVIHIAPRSRSHDDKFCDSIRTIETYRNRTPKERHAWDSDKQRSRVHLICGMLARVSGNTISGWLKGVHVPKPS